MQRRALSIFASAFAVVIVACHSRSSATYFPLRVGNQWEYSLRGDPNVRRVVTIAESKPIDGVEWFRLKSSLYLASSRDATSTPQLNLPGAVNVVSDDDEWMRVDRDRLYVLDHDRSALWADFNAQGGNSYQVGLPCNQAAKNSQTEAGLVIAYQQTCSDAGLIEQAFLPNVGLQRSVEDSEAGRRTWLLVSTQVNGKVQKY